MDLKTIGLPPSVRLTTEAENRRLDWRRRHVRRSFKPRGGWRQKPLWSTTTSDGREIS